MAEQTLYPPIGDYALISDSHSAALVSRALSVDWCCIKRLDMGSCFNRILDWKKGGYCSITPRGDDWSTSRRYLDGTLVLETIIEAESGEARILDFFARPSEDGEGYPYRQLFRIVEGTRGYAEFDLEIVPRFNYAGVRPWVRQEEVRFYSAIGGSDGLLISSDAGIVPGENHDFRATFEVHAGERVRTTIMWVSPERLDREQPQRPDAQETDRRLEETIEWWRDWSSRLTYEGPDRSGVRRSALALKGLMNDTTGAVAAAATTSLPEVPGRELNWDYRYSWIRDSFFSVRSLAEVGFTAEAERFRRFIERSAAGSADELQIMYGVGGERRLTESILGYLDGYGGASPVRIGNAAADQLQLGVYGELLDLSWRWHQRGNSPDDDYWRFILDLVDKVCDLWDEPDSGLWEARGDPQHYTLSKVMCWAALDRGIRLAEESLRQAPMDRWKKVRDEVREAIEEKGYDEERGVFVQSFGNKDLDASLLLIPKVDFISYRDERMVRTADAIREELDDNGLLLRYPASREMGEGAFVACAFWLAECLAHQGRAEEARRTFDQALAAGNDLGLFSEEYGTAQGQLLGNFPQGLSHLSHISAALALAEGSP